MVKASSDHNEGEIVKEAPPHPQGTQPVEVMQSLVIPTSEAESHSKADSSKLVRLGEEGEKKKEKKTKPFLGKMSSSFRIVSRNPRYVKLKNK